MYAAITPAHGESDVRSSRPSQTWMDIVRPAPAVEYVLTPPARCELRLFFDPRDPEVELQGSDLAFVFPDGARLVLLGLVDMAERGEAGEIVTTDCGVLSVLDLLRAAQHVNSLARALLETGP